MLQVVSILTISDARRVHWVFPYGHGWQFPTASWLYRLYAVDRSLLYIGIAKCINYRFSAHASSKPWFTDVTYVGLTPFKHRWSALQFEGDAIKTEDPLHNIASRGAPESRVRMTEPLARMVVVDSGAAPSLAYARGAGSREQGGGSREEKVASASIPTLTRARRSTLRDTVLLPARSRMDGMNRCR